MAEHIPYCLNALYKQLQQPVALTMFYTFFMLKQADFIYYFLKIFKQKIMQRYFYVISLVALGVLSTTLFTNAQETSTLPNFSFYDLEDNVVTANDIDYEHYLTFVYFDPSCEHCIEQVEEINAEFEQFKKTVLVFVSFADAETTSEFAKKYFPDNPSNVIFLQDKDMVIFDYFNDLYDTPTFKIFDTSGKQIFHTEQVPVAEIYKHYK